MRFWRWVNRRERVLHNPAGARCGGGGGWVCLIIVGRGLRPIFLRFLTVRFVSSEPILPETEPTNGFLL